VARGVAEGRFEVTSFGEQRPAAQGEGEEAWSKNRRAEFEITAGAGSIKAP
jgi:peptidoglycan-associated lipoprotein